MVPFTGKGKLIEALTLELKQVKAELEELKASPRERRGSIRRLEARIEEYSGYEQRNKELVAHLARVEDVIHETFKYLDSNKFNSIVAGSHHHKAIVEILNESPKESLRLVREEY